MMKKFIFVSFLLLTTISSVSAGIKTDADSAHFSNPITIYNYAGVDIAYIMMGVYGGLVYGIRQGSNDIYHAGAGDQYASFEVGTCAKMDFNGADCSISSEVKSCVGPDHYNANLIKSIQVNSLDSCTVTCLDGGNITCKQS